MADKKPVLLVIEDDPGLQAQLKWAYEGYRVVTAANRAQAIEMLRLHEPAVVTLDDPHRDQLAVDRDAEVGEGGLIKSRKRDRDRGRRPGQHQRRGCTRDDLGAPRAPGAIAHVIEADRLTG